MLEELFGSRLRAAVIARLFSRAGERLFVRQLSVLTNEDPANVSRELARLERLGLVVSVMEGRQKYYRANEKSSVYQELRGLAMKTVGLADVLRGALKPLSAEIEVAFVYGSLAAGNETPQGDVDLFVVGEVSLRKLAPALRRASETLAREINPVVLSQAELKSRIRKHDHFVTTVLDSPKIFLVGDAADLKRVYQQRVSGKA
jgi:uncharacterized protein